MVWVCLQQYQYLSKRRHLLQTAVPQELLHPSGPIIYRHSIMHMLEWQGACRKVIYAYHCNKLTAIPFSILTSSNSNEKSDPTIKLLTKDFPFISKIHSSSSPPPFSQYNLKYLSERSTSLSKVMDPGHSLICAGGLGLVALAMAAVSSSKEVTVVGPPAYGPGYYVAGRGSLA